MSFPIYKIDSDVENIIVNQLEMASFTSLASINRSGRYYVCNKIRNELYQLVNYVIQHSQEGLNSNLEKCIYAKWINVRCEMDLESVNKKGCFGLKTFKKAFDLLKMFNHVVFNTFSETDKIGLLKLNCPLLIKEMFSSDTDEILWTSSNYNFKVNSIAKELKKIDLFEGNCANVESFSCPPQKLASFFVSCYSKETNLCLGTCIKNQGSSLPPFSLRIGDVINLDATYKVEKTQSISIQATQKWNALKNLYHYFSKIEDLLLKEKEEKNKSYSEIFSHIKNNLYFELGPRQQVEQRLGNGYYCFRWSSTLKDSHGNSQVVMTFKLYDGTLDYWMPNLVDYNSTEEFDKALQNVVVSKKLVEFQSKKT